MLVTPLVLIQIFSKIMLVDWPKCGSDPRDEGHLARLGDVDKVERLLPRVRNPADVRCGGWWTQGETLLHFFCHNGWLDMTRG